MRFFKYPPLILLLAVFCACGGQNNIKESLPVEIPKQTAGENTGEAAPAPAKETQEEKYAGIIEKYKNKTPRIWALNPAGALKKIKTQEKIIALTFDICGSPKEELDVSLIDYLVKEKIPAAIFINGRWIKQYPAKFTSLAQNPLFEIENHGMMHKPASISGRGAYHIKGTADARELIKEIDDNGLLIEKLTGRKPLFYRSATAFYDEYAVQIANDLGYKVMGFSVIGDAGGVFKEPDIEKAMSKVKPGDVVIFHLIKPKSDTRKSLEKIIPELQKQNYKFVKLEDYAGLLY